MRFRVFRLQKAITHLKVLQIFKQNALIEASLQTGRTHQIRVHLAHIKHPVVGDEAYGFKKQRFNLQGQALHSKFIEFTHPETNKTLHFETDYPTYFQCVLDKIK